MKNSAKKFVFIWLLAAIVIVFSGCGGKSVETPDSDVSNSKQNQTQNTDYISGMLGVKNQAEKNINDATQKENAKINEAIGENAETLKFVETPELGVSTTDFTKKYNAAKIETNFGEIEVKFYTADAPLAVNNFMKLADSKFYDGTKFHRVIKGFMIQGGDPNSKDDNWNDDGQGGPGYSFKDEINSHKLLRGSLAMANSGPDTNGSQFFIVTAAATSWLDGKHTNFGEVTKGMDVVDKIENAAVNSPQVSHPTQDVVIKKITLLEK
ncbi:MAG: peptidylprolyl isomerase [bacterium]|nr:peptidylprolyl isomerase [bacterium]